MRMTEKSPVSNDHTAAAILKSRLLSVQFGHAGEASCSLTQFAGMETCAKIK
jgi:hypothetical protein